MQALPDAMTGDAADLAQHRMYRHLSEASDLGWTSSEALYTLDWLQNNPTRDVLGTFISKHPFSLERVYAPTGPKEGFQGSQLPPPAFEVKREVFAGCSNPVVTSLADLSIWSAKPETLKVWSPILIEVLLERTSLGSTPEQKTLLPGFQLEAPYYYLLPFVPELQLYTQTQNGLGQQQMLSLLRYLSPFIDSKLKPALRDLASSPSDPVTTFAHIWYLFPPGTEVYVKRGSRSREQGALVLRCEYNNNILVLLLWSIVIGQNGLKSKLFNHEISEFNGSLPVLSLTCCPAKIVDDSDQQTTRKECLRRTRKFLDLLASHHPQLDYEGPVSWVGSSRREILQGHYRGPVIIDHWSAFDDTFADASELRESIIGNDPRDVAKKFATGSSNLGADWWDTGNCPEEKIRMKLKWLPFPLTEQHALIFMHETFAFGLKDKKWISVEIGQLKEVRRLPDPLKNVIIPEDDIALIKALSFRRNEAQATWGADFIEGKGMGKIVLLHGPPGVGKTYTVECIAEAFAMPLLDITIANVSLEEKWMERDLRMWFTLAVRWNAILLLDEADVFLERRQPTDLERNALVASLLRLIEYYTGLLFLTTNRVGQIDDAFSSRIHVVIGYSKINETSRRKIWNAFFEKLERERDNQIIVGDNAREYVLNDPELAALKWNGREIRNALQTVIALAGFEASQRTLESRRRLVIIEEAHFRKYVRMSKAYQDYTFKVAKQDESKRAHIRKERYDYDD